MNKIFELRKKINILENEPMSLHTSFKTGGPARFYARPGDFTELALLVEAAASDGLPVFILGGGANILVADKGISGLVIATGGLRRHSLEGSLLRAGAGLPISDAAGFAADAGLEGLDFIHAMPGSAGGAVYMNARCYGYSVSDVLEELSFLPPGGLLPEKRGIEELRAGFAYKKSPFQSGGSLSGAVIIEAVFRLRPGDKALIRDNMRRIEEDRKAKGHFMAPSAGSVFKNNHAFGQPTGKILDELGMRGFRHGGAQVSPLHGNIIINTGNASSGDIRGLMEILAMRAKDERGIVLEPEIIFAGEWE